MIRVRVNGKPGKVEAFLVWGHAHSAAYGEDLVCAAVSAVATTALKGLIKKACGSVRYCVLPQGLIYCRLSAGMTETAARDAQVIVEVMLLGLEAIRNAHPKNISVKWALSGNMD